MKWELYNLNSNSKYRPLLVSIKSHIEETWSLNQLNKNKNIAMNFDAWCSGHTVWG